MPPFENGSAPLVPQPDPIPVGAEEDLALVLESNGTIPSANGRHALPKGVNRLKVANLTQFMTARLRRDRAYADVARVMSNYPAPASHGVRLSNAIRRKMRGAPAIALGLSFMKAPLLNLEWWLRAETKQGKEAAALATHVLKQHARPLFRRGLRAIEFGWQVFEWIWEPRTLRIQNDDFQVNKTFPDALVPIHFHDFAPEMVAPLVHPADGTFLGVALNDALPLGEERLIPREKLFVVANDPEYQDPRGYSVLDLAYEPFYWGKIAAMMLVKFIERRGVPGLKVTAPAVGEWEDQKTGDMMRGIDIALAAAADYRQGGELALPSDVDPDSKAPYWGAEPIQFDEKAGEMLVDAVRFFDDWTLMALGIPPKVLLQGTRVGSFAETKEITGSYLETLEEMKYRLIDEPVQRQLLPVLAALNFGTECEIPVFETESFKKADLAAIARATPQVFEAKHAVRGSDGVIKGFATIADLMDPWKFAAGNRIKLVDPDSWEPPPEPVEPTGEETTTTTNATGTKKTTMKRKVSGPSGEKRSEDTDAINP